MIHSMSIFININSGIYVYKLNRLVLEIISKFSVICFISCVTYVLKKCTTDIDSSLLMSLTFTVCVSLILINVVYFLRKSCNESYKSK